MLSKDAFIDFILNGSDKGTDTAPKAPAESALPEGFEGFDEADTQAPPVLPGSSFARRLLEASGFGYAEMVQRNNVIRSTDAVAQHLPDRVSFWPQTPTRKYYTLLFETDLNHKQLLAIPAFKSRRMAHLDIVEDALARLVSEALEGFQRGGEGVTADVRKGRKEETLCVVSIVDEREGKPVRLVCFGTQNKSTDGLETFQITEQTRNWDPQLAREHLGLLYERQFKKLEGQDWQEAFTTTEERKQADKLLAVCTRKAPKEHDIQEGVLDLLDTIAKGFGLRRKPNTNRRLQAFALPSDHDIGIDPEERESSFGGKNPFGGVTLRDERSRLLGYIVYPLKSKSDATRLRKHLEKNNRFHNVLVVYPDEDQASLELWQGQEQLTGKLRKGQGYKDAADVVNLLSRFFVVSKAKVKNPMELAQELAYRARYLRRLAVKQLEEEPEKGPLRNLYNAFKEALVHDQTEDEFADAFAQTITYGLLTARWTGNDQLVADGERLTRQTALKHLPAASPFLNDLFKSALSVKLDEQRGRLLWLVDDIADLLDRIDVTYVFGAGDKDSDSATDPVIHFYEPFLAAYDKELKNKRGVFFTPRPVVSYIVRSVHELLQKEFGLEDGLASIDTWADVARRIKGLEIPEGVKASDPFVCILDPATGTGTFLFECIEVIERTMKDRWCRELKKKDWKDPAIAARWSEYVPQYLLPRLVGFELMMASYAIAHLKLSFKLAQTGHRLSQTDRLGVYLTNSLEPPQGTANPRLASLFETLAQEAQAVDNIKQHSRFTVLSGNPPYAGNSANASRAENGTLTFVGRLVEDYKEVDGAALGERQPKWLQDDYVKFIRLATYLLEASRAGIIGFITNHSYLSNPTFRGMRQSLLCGFRQSYALDLHGSSKKRELAPDGMVDENVFDIQQGVAIFLGIASPGEAHSKSTMFHSHLWGNRATKYSKLASESVANTTWSKLDPSSPFYLFTPQQEDLRAEYDCATSITQIMPAYNVGFVSARDKFVIDIDRKELEARIDLFRKPEREVPTAKICERFGLKNTSSWSVSDARRRVRDNPKWKHDFHKCLYRPFDVRNIYYSRDVLERPVYQIQRHMLDEDNIGLVLTRSVEIGRGFEHVFCTQAVVQHHTVSIKEVNYLFPLHLKPDDQGLNLHETIVENIDREYQGRLQSMLGLPRRPASKQVFNFIYALLHSPSYRTRYEGFLRVDFPRIPLPATATLFEALARFGGELVGHHTPSDEGCARRAKLEWFGGSDCDRIECVRYSDGAIWLDKKGTRGIGGISDDTWAFHIGGYRICEKWLKDRKGRVLSGEDIDRYAVIIGAIDETIRIMGEIDRVIDKHGGWPGAFVTKPAGGKK